MNSHQLPTFLVKHSGKTKGRMAKMQQRRKDFICEWSRGQVAEQSETQQDVHCMSGLSH